MTVSHKASRQTDIEAARGVAILLVVYAHGLALFFGAGAAPLEAAFVQWQFLASCGMPFFFLVSGLVYRVKSHRKAFIASLTFLFIAYACHVAGWVLASAVEGELSLKALAMPLIKHTGLLPVAIWFLVTIAFVQLIYHFAERASAPRRWLIVGGVAVLFAVSHATERNYFYIGAWAPGLLFLAAGHALAKSGWLFRKVRYPVLGWLGIAVLMVVTAWLAPLNEGCLLDPTTACLYENGKFSVSLMDGSTGFLPLFLLSAVVGSYAFWLLMQELTRSEAIAGRLARQGRNSLALFTLNAFVLSFVQPLLQPALPAEVPLGLVIGLPVALGIVQLAAMRWWRPLNDALLRSAGRLAKATVDRLHPPANRKRGAHASQPADLAPSRGPAGD